MINQKFIKRSVGIILGALLLAGAQPASATWTGATNGTVVNVSRQYLNTDNWVNGDIDDSFSGVTLTGDLTLYITGANRTTTGDMNFNYAGLHDLTITAAASQNRRIVLSGDVLFDPEETGRTLTIGGSGVTPIEFARDTTFTVSASNTLVKPAGTGTMIGGGYQLIKEGAGVLEIGQGTANNFQLVVNEGEFRYGNFRVMGDNGRSITISDNGTVNLQSFYESTLTTLILNGGTLKGTGVGSGAGGEQTSIFRTSASGIASTGGGDINFSGSGNFILNGNVTYTNGAANKALVINVGSGNFDLNGGTRTFTVADESTQAIDVDVQTKITGTGGITKEGLGTMRLGGANTYSGATTVNDGLLLYNGSLAAGAGAVTVNSGGALGGTGTVSRAVTIASGGTLAPGNSAGIFTVAALTLASNSTFAVELGGLSAGSFDQLIVTGDATLSNSVLNVSLINAFNPTVGDSFLILTNGGSTFGMFAGLVEGAQFIAGSETFAISYFGGDGNDVLLTVIPEPSTWMLVGLGLLGVLLLRAKPRST